LWEWAIVLHGRVLIPFGCGWALVDATMIQHSLVLAD
jgi:hypothetical protein